MRDYTSEKVKKIKPSGIRKFFDLLDGSTDVISLGIGEPDFVTPWHIRDAGIYSLEKGFTYYTANAGLTSLRDEIAAYLIRRFDLEYDPKSQIVVTVGGSEAIDLALRATVNDGDEVIIPQPSFVCYEPLCALAGGVPVILNTCAEDRFKINPEKLRACITPKTKILVLPYPCNPTGAVMEYDELSEIAKIVEENDLLVVSDEIYAELIYGIEHTSFPSLPGMKERTILVNGFSKAYAMTGWRLGYAAGPEDIMNVIVKIHQFGIMSAPTTAQFAAIKALQDGDDDIMEMRGEYDRRRKYLHERLNKMGLDCFEPQGAFYLFPSIKFTGLSSEEFCERLLLQKRVAVIPGPAFGDVGEGFVRMCYASSYENIQEAADRIEEFIREL